MKVGQKVIQNKKELAQYLIGKPYQHNTWFGTYRPYEEKPEKVIAEVTDQQTGQHSRWIFDAQVAYNQYINYLDKRRKIVR